MSPSFVRLFGIESAEEGKTNVPTWYVLDIEGKVQTPCILLVPKVSQG